MRRMSGPRLTRRQGEIVDTDRIRYGQVREGGGRWPLVADTTGSKMAEWS